MEKSFASKRSLGVLWLLVLICFGSMLFLLFRDGVNYRGLHADQVSIRQSNGSVQYRVLDGSWQTITTVDALTGANGKDGQSGRDGNNGKDGKDGQNGTDGRNGSNGQEGAPGSAGSRGAAGAKGSAGADGADGREIELQKTSLYIQWRYVGDTTWNNVVALSDLKGDKGDNGDVGATGPANVLSIGAVSRSACAPTASITGTTPSQTLDLGIPGIPLGGAQGQVLTKSSASDCDASWQSTHELRGTGMPNGQVVASPGTYYTDTAGTNGAWRWLKTAGGGNSGWTVVYGDTGWRNISTYFDTTASSNTNKTMSLRRVNNTVMVQFHGTLSRNGQIVSAPAGKFAGFESSSRLDSPGVATVRLQIGNSTVTVYGSINVNDASVMHFADTQFTDQPWPTVLP